MAANLDKIIIDLEKKALERWNNGDPGGYLDASASDVVYFDPFTEQRLDGIDALRKHYEPIWGQVKVTSYELKNPKVHATDGMAVLTFNLLSHSAQGTSRWNCTEVYRLEKSNNWKIVQTHWSFTKPEFREAMLP